MKATLYENINVNKSMIDINNEILNYWKENHIDENIIKSNRNLKPFAFLEGPPTANGRPHVGHLMTRAVKDTVMRYKYMTGHDILRRTGGWDCHGLPVELEAEKHFGFKNKKDIENFGIEKFNQYCRDSVFRYIDEWNIVDDLVGFWVDKENSYITLKNDYMESEWWALKTLYENNLLVKDYKIVPYCPRCGTSLSSHEVAQGYKNVDDPSVFVKFAEKGRKNRYFIAWTTTPWTLPSNEFLVVNPDMDYSLIESDGFEYYLLSSKVESLFNDYKLIKTFKGRDLEGIEYEQLMPFLEKPENAFRVVAASFVTAEDGTGIVHAAPAFGADDFEIGKRFSVEILNPVDQDGRFNEKLPWSGLFVTDANKSIINYLKENNLLFKAETMKHDYPFCYRCGTRLLYYPLDTWFIKVSLIRKKLLENNEKINWVPDYLKNGRFGNFLEEAKDWALSRDRYWGTPLPIWRCNKNHYLAIGSRDDLLKYGGYIPEDLHRPYIDDVVLKCPECGSEMHRESYVIDTWFDSGSASYAAMHYPFSKDFTKSHFPVDFITEAIDQTRGWFYTLHVVASLLFDENAYKNVVSISHILDENGQKMSKSKGNFIAAIDFLNDYGADAARMFFFTGAPWNSKSVNKKLIGEITRKNLSTLLNVYSFFASNANIDEYRFTEIKEPENLLDRWMLSRLNTTIIKVRENMDNYNIHTALRYIEDLISELSNVYLRLSRKRFWEGNLDDSKERAYSTLYYTLRETIKMMAPITPFFSEYLYQKLSPGMPSVHMESYPEAIERFIDNDLENEMEHAIEIMELSRRTRQELNIKGRQPVKEILIYSDIKLRDDIIDIISPELNAESIRFIKSDEMPLKITVRADISKVAKLLKSRINDFNLYLERNNDLVYRELKSKGKINFDGIYLTDDMFIMNEEVNGNYGFNKDERSGIYLFINREIDNDLLLEGYAREIIRRIQVMRKDLNLEYSEKIKTYIDADEDIRSAVERYMEKIKNETLSSEILFKNDPEARAWDIDDKTVYIKIVK
ncbi:isoleucine--tRNA ligase [Picrophilus oshimae]|uniref:Isoleucine--tRNA ligase n=1 Tax=Picrophilus torridus (strain ATCC 700027 / DSM 9790 / JCM 10055 / NBRC 100828 / KAW 2/3) TaxID=1122961 RepID=SYI_PICTO|nr:isoleucine--tRNA ligase [Picrophilus oshimae]Q6L206.1 RecName: Full=Isoleucine--tRNA ligase; AltName: Full=Isoleucyl-tRNA synthetase; Short=IleRS [Picrophilus oshimae DSM 9789]AAT42996.1 isoleucyl-tRNA synthetase [Picrophilus oshimae DSM 9789]